MGYNYTIIFYKYIINSFITSPVSKVACSYFRSKTTFEYLPLNITYRLYSGQRMKQGLLTPSDEYVLISLSFYKEFCRVLIVFLVCRGSAGFLRTNKYQNLGLDVI